MRKLRAGLFAAVELMEWQRASRPFCGRATVVGRVAADLERDTRAPHGLEIGVSCRGGGDVTKSAARSQRRSRKWGLVRAAGRVLAQIAAPAGRKSCSHVVAVLF